MRLGRLGLGELLAAAGGAALIAAVFHPWYSIHLSATASDAIVSQAGLDPVSAALFERGLNAGFESSQPTAWALFDRTDLVLLGIAALAVLTAVLAFAGVVDRSQPRMLVLGVSAVVAVGFRLAISPFDEVPAVEVAPREWGWVALVGAVAVAGSALIPTPPGRSARPNTAVAGGPTQPAPAFAAAPAGSYPAAAREAGWYEDPHGPGLRYWDGNGWTWETRDSKAPA